MYDILFQLGGISYMLPEYPFLPYGLSVPYIYFIQRPIGGNNDQRDITIESFGNCGIIIKEGTSGSTDQYYGLRQLLGHTKGKKSGTALVHNTETRKKGIIGKPNGQRGVSGSRGNHYVLNSLGLAVIYDSLCHGDIGVFQRC